MKKKIIILGIIILGTFGAFVVYRMYNKPHVDVSEASVDISISATKIVEKFSSDETLANVTYLDKIVAVKGVISNKKIEKEVGVITLKTDDDFGSVLCYLSPVSSKKMDAFKVGKTITIKGICTGYLMDVILVKSEIIN